jgi:hypothetical protein
MLRWGRTGKGGTLRLPGSVQDAGALVFSHHPDATPTGLSPPDCRDRLDYEAIEVDRAIGRMYGDWLALPAWKLRTSHKFAQEAGRQRKNDREGIPILSGAMPLEIGVNSMLVFVR